MKTTFQFLFVFLLVISMNSCSNMEKRKTIDVKVLKHKYFPNLSSASGVVYQNGITYLIGDDLPFLFELDTDWNITSQRKISTIDSVVNGRTQKKLKADFESMALLDIDGEIYILLLSSGSKMVTRDTAFLVSLNEKEKVFKKSLRPLFDYVKKQAGLQAENEINIEALAFSKEKAYILHRGNVSENFIVEIDADLFINFIITESDEVPKINVFPFELPNDNGLSAGFSGACYLPEYDGLLFTASLENTSNEIDDGAVLGSYLGYISIPKLKKGKFLAKLITQDNAVLAKKQEGIAIKSIHKNRIVVQTVCDNDDGSSDLFELEVLLSK